MLFLERSLFGIYPLLEYILYGLHMFILECAIFGMYPLLNVLFLEWALFGMCSV